MIDLYFCDCGVNICSHSKERHFKTKYHQNRMDILNDIIPKHMGPTIICTCGNEVQITQLKKHCLSQIHKQRTKKCINDTYMPKFLENIS